MRPSQSRLGMCVGYLRVPHPKVGVQVEVRSSLRELLDREARFRKQARGPSEPEDLVLCQAI